MTTKYKQESKNFSFTTTPKYSEHGVTENNLLNIKLN